MQALPSVEPFLQAGAPERKFRSKSNCLLLYPANTGSLRGPVPNTLRRLISAVNAFPLKFTTRRPPAGNFHTTRTMVFWCPLVATKSCMNERSDLGSEAASMPMFPYSIRGRLQLRARLREVRLRLYAAIVECGCWKGGMSAALIEIGGFQRDYYFFDSFEGLPPRRPSMVVLRLLGRPTRPRRRITTIAQRALMTFAGQYVEPDVPNFHPRLQSSRRFPPFLRRRSQFSASMRIGMIPLWNVCGSFGTSFCPTV